MLFIYNFHTFITLCNYFLFSVEKCSQICIKLGDICGGFEVINESECQFGNVNNLKRALWSHSDDLKKQVYVDTAIPYGKIHLKAITNPSLIDRI